MPRNLFAALLRVSSSTGPAMKPGHRAFVGVRVAPVEQVMNLTRKSASRSSVAAAGPRARSALICAGVPSRATLSAVVSGVIPAWCAVTTAFGGRGELGAHLVDGGVALNRPESLGGC